MDNNVAFLVWNYFQFQQVKSILRIMDNATLIIEKRLDNRNIFTSDILDEIKCNIVFIDYDKILTIDGKYTIIVAQTPFTDIHLFKKSKIVFLQYGYAKDKHNFGEWRALANTTLTFGSYASEQINSYCNTIITGNPRYDILSSSEFHEKSKKRYSEILDSSKKTLVYLPTWGKLSSVDLYLEELNKLTNKYNIIIKIHHITGHIERKRAKIIDKTNLIKVDFNVDNLELISIADVVVSDYSGAIFDALYCKKKIVLLNISDNLIETCKRVSKNSLEISEREILGSVVREQKELSNIIENTITNKEESLKLHDLKKRLFKETDKATLYVVKALKDIEKKEYVSKTKKEFILKYKNKYSSKNFIYKLKHIYFFIKSKV